MTTTGQMQPTAGPWVQFADGGKCVAIMPAGRPGDICTFEQSPSDADAALMTAAPDMLAALRAARGPLDILQASFGWLDTDGTREQVRAALARVEPLT